MIRVTRDVAHQNVEGEEILRGTAAAEKAVLILFQIVTIERAHVGILVEEGGGTKKT